MHYSATLLTAALALAPFTTAINDGQLTVICYADTGCGGDAGGPMVMNFPNAGPVELCATTTGQKSCSAAWGGDPFYNTVAINVFPNNGPNCPSLDLSQCTNYILTKNEAPTCFDLKHPNGDYADTTYMTTTTGGDCCINC